MKSSFSLSSKLGSIVCVDLERNFGGWWIQPSPNLNLLSDRRLGLSPTCRRFGLAHGPRPQILCEDVDHQEDVPGGRDRVQEDRVQLEPTLGPCAIIAITARYFAYAGLNC